MGSLLSLYFLHPIKTWLTNKTQRIYSRYELTNPSKTPPPPFVFSLLSVILLHLHYTLQSPSPSVTTPLFLCYPVSSYPVPLFSSSVTTLCSFVTLSPFTLSPYTLLCKECLPVLSTGAFTLSKTRPFKHAEHAFLAPWRRLSCPLTMPFLEIRVQVFDSKEVTIVKETDVMSLSKWFG